MWRLSCRASLSRPRLLFLLLHAAASSAALGLAGPVVTPSPRAASVDHALHRRQADSSFIGWYTTNNAWASTHCQTDQVFSTGGRFAACCQSGVATCAMATACSDNIVVYPDGQSGVCLTCDTLTIRLSTVGPAAQTFIRCINTDDLFTLPNTIYRETTDLTTPTKTVTATVTATDTATETESQEAGAVPGSIPAVVLAAVAAGLAAAAALAL